MYPNDQYECIHNNGFFMPDKLKFNNFRFNHILPHSPSHNTMLQQYNFHSNNMRHRQRHQLHSSARNPN